ncbi:hypothetical protein QF042_001914 [Pedobacter sp. W3I1]|uniref:hypothetical protein n=1 Tax=Pedobacter sp. W3I1 TaxID=3042291 RepID=UPI002783C1ED|nr:hypothetical protein [Pedobacter sp. W3I1]MDQ0638349.1 hypothetical protein [Pedobacter sp. W3I1]
MKKHFYKILASATLYLFCAYPNRAMAQDQTINGNLNIGAGFHNALGYGPRIYFLGNSDDFFISHFNSGGNQSEFRFGIGDDFQPEDKFSIGVNYAGDGQWYDRMVVQGDGNVGIGTSSPQSKLQVNGGAVVVGTNSVATNADGHVSIGNITEDSNPTQADWIPNSTLLLNAHDYSSIGFHDSGVRVDFIRAGNGTIQLGYDGGFGNANIGLPLGIWNAQGNVGIGTLNPQEKLSVKGKIRAQEIKVEMTGWPDFVFEPKYSLMPLRSLESYINENKHLPGIPSAAEVKEQGIELGAMNKKLLQKIEELSLYIIQQDKKITDQQQRAVEERKSNLSLQEDIELLKTQMKKLIEKTDQ